MFIVEESKIGILKILRCHFEEQGDEKSIIIYQQRDFSSVIRRIRNDKHDHFFKYY